MKPADLLRTQLAALEARNAAELAAIERHWARVPARPLVFGRPARRTDREYQPQLFDILPKEGELF